MTVADAGEGSSKSIGLVNVLRAARRGRMPMSSLCELPFSFTTTVDTLVYMIHLGGYESAWLYFPFRKINRIK